jgi:hypothetical protein
MKRSPVNGESLVEQGREISRFDTFGDEEFWGDTLGLHRAIEGEKLGGVGPGLSPATALGVGLKVDQDALPPGLLQQIKLGKVNLSDPAVTVALLKLNAVLGVTGFFKPDGTLKSVGIQCGFCHSTVDNASAPGIGHRLDGWANRDLNVGAIVGLSAEPSAGSRCPGCGCRHREDRARQLGPESLMPNYFWTEKRSVRMARAQPRWFLPPLD